MPMTYRCADGISIYVDNILLFLEIIWIADLQPSTIVADLSQRLILAGQLQRPHSTSIQDRWSCMHGMLLKRNHRTATFRFWSKRLLATVLVWLGNTRAVDLCIESVSKQRQCSYLPWFCNTKPYVHVTCVRYTCALSVTLLFPNTMTFRICCICIHAHQLKHVSAWQHNMKLSETSQNYVSDCFGHDGLASVRQFAVKRTLILDLGPPAYVSSISL